MHNKALWFRYFLERSGPKSAGRPGRPLTAHVPEPHRWHRSSRPSLTGLKRTLVPR